MVSPLLDLNPSPLYRRISFCESSFKSFSGPLVAVIALFNLSAALSGSAFIIASHASIGPPNALVTTARQPPGIDLTFNANLSTI